MVSGVRSRMDLAGAVVRGVVVPDEAVTLAVVRVAVVPGEAVSAPVPAVPTDQEA